MNALASIAPGLHIPTWHEHERFRKAREDTGMTQTEFANITGLSRRMISAIESGEREPTLKTYNLWQLATGVPREWLRTGEAPPPSGDEASGWYTPRDSNPEPTDSGSLATVTQLRPRVEADDRPAA